MAAWPAAVTDPLRVPLALAKVPVPPTIVSVSVPEKGKAGLGWHAPGQVGLLKTSSMKIDPPARLMVRKSQLPPQAAPNTIFSVAWPNGRTCPCPQELVARSHPLWAAGADSVNVMLIGTVVAAIAGEARATGRSMRAPEVSTSANTRFIVGPPLVPAATRQPKSCKPTSAHLGRLRAPAADISTRILCHCQSRGHPGR